MVEPRFFKVSDLLDLIEILDYCRYVVYKIEEEDDDKSYIKILASRFYWEGWISHNKPIYQELIDILSRKGIRVEGALDLNQLAEKF